MAEFLEMSVAASRLAYCARVVVVLVTLLAAALVITPTPAAYAVPGCCVCFNCSNAQLPFCQDQMTSPPDCVTFCADAGCPASTFSTVDTCFTGCGTFGAFPTPTPTMTPTPSITLTPSQTPTPSQTHTPSNTPTPLYCCQCPLSGGGSTCGESTLITACDTSTCARSTDFECIDTGACVTRTPSQTPTNTKPTNTPIPTITQTPTKTQTGTPTPSRTIGGFNIDPYACYRAKSSEASAAKGTEIAVVDAFGQKMTKILKPFFECAPAKAGNSGDILNPEDFLTCYKAKDLEKLDLPDVTVRNMLDDGLELTLAKGQLLCMPSIANFALPPPAPTATPAATPTVTNTPGSG